MAKSWPDCGVLCKPLHFANAQKSLFAAHLYGEHWTRVSVGRFVFVLYLLKCTGDSDLTAGIEDFYTPFSKLYVRQQTCDILCYYNGKCYANLPS